MLLFFFFGFVTEALESGIYSEGDYGSRKTFSSL